VKEEGWEINPVPADFDEAYDEDDDEAEDNATEENEIVHIFGRKITPINQSWRHEEFPSSEIGR
jgi:hypothetical protein